MSNDSETNWSKNRIVLFEALTTKLNLDGFNTLVRTYASHEIFFNTTKADGFEGMCTEYLGWLERNNEFGTLIKVLRENPNYRIVWQEIEGKSKNIPVEQAPPPQPNHQSRPTIPVIILAMTAAQAQEIPSILARQNEITPNILRSVQAFIPNKQEQELWLSRYGQTPAEWRPYIVQNQIWGLNIGEDSVETILNELWENIEGEIELVSHHNITEQLKSIRRGIIIIDVLSLVHPALRSVFNHRSWLKNTTQNLVLTVTPIRQADMAQWEQLIALENNSLPDENLFGRFYSFNDWCALGFNRRPWVDQWLSVALKKQLENLSQPDSGRRQQARQTANTRNTGAKPF